MKRRRNPSTTTVLALGAAGVAAYLLLRKGHGETPPRAFLHGGHVVCRLDCPPGVLCSDVAFVAPNGVCPPGYR